MKRTLSTTTATVAAFLLFFALAAARPALAGTSAVERGLDVTLTDFPDRVYLGANLEGTVTISMREGGASAKTADIVVYVDTPVGRAAIASEKVRLAPGRTKAIPFSMPVSEDAPTGPFEFTVEVRYAGEVASASHTIYVVGGK
jgi:hypothetical protein